MYCTNVRQHVVLSCKPLPAPVHVARKRLRKCVRDAVSFENSFLLESPLAQFTGKRRFIVQALVCVQLASFLECFVAFRAFKGVHRAEMCGGESPKLFVLAFGIKCLFGVSTSIQTLLLIVAQQYTS